MYSTKDLQQFREKGISEQIINKQINYFKNGFPFLEIVNPATINNGLTQISENNKTNLINIFDEYSKNNKILKFVPASGAASRMFKVLFEFLDNSKISEPKHDENFASVYTFFKRLNEFAFIDDLNKIVDTSENNYKKTLEYFLTNKGLNYGNLPKGLLKFHKYDNKNRTSFEEHLVEGANYSKSMNNNVYLHFTVSNEHMELFKSFFNQIKNDYEKELGIKFIADFSVQQSSTDTIAVDMDNMPFRNTDESILFRPGGHGALIANLNKIDSDIIFIKNIDNVVTDKLKQETYNYKKIIAGKLISLQDKIFAYLKSIDNNENINLAETENFVENELNLKFPSDYFEYDNSKKLEFIRNKLNRPIRVCGMVKNQGEPGGGPFWTRNNDKSLSLQIVESSQINLLDTNQKSIFDKSTHFNPVDLVIATKNYKGEKFNLSDFIDEETGFISKKSQHGKDLKALELPGLWNGAMANWNTIFVEVPLITFNPVKIINDLLRPEHSY